MTIRHCLINILKSQKFIKIIILIKKNTFTGDSGVETVPSFDV